METELQARDRRIEAEVRTIGERQELAESAEARAAQACGHGPTPTCVHGGARQHSYWTLVLHGTAAAALLHTRTHNVIYVHVCPARTVHSRSLKST